MGALASLDQREEVRRSLKALRRRRPRSSSATRSTSTSSAPTPSAARSCPRSCCRPTTPPGRAARGRGVRPGQHADRLPRHPRRHRAGRPRQGQPGRLGRHRGPGLRPRRRARHRALARPPARARPRRRPGVHRPRLAAAGAGARRPGPGRRRRGDGRHARRLPPHAAHRHPGQPAHADRPSPAAGSRARPATSTTPTRSASRWPGCASATRSSAGPAHGHPRRHRALRRVHRRHVLRAHGRGSRREEPVLRRPRRPRLPGRVARGRAVRPSRLRPRAGQLRHRQPALPHAGLPGRRDDRDADLQADQPAGRRLRRGPLGRRAHQPGRRRRWPPTTCSPWSPSSGRRTS